MKEKKKQAKNHKTTAKLTLPRHNAFKSNSVVEYLDVGVVYNGVDTFQSSEMKTLQMNT